MVVLSFASFAAADQIHLGVSAQLSSTLYARENGGKELGGGRR